MQFSFTEFLRAVQVALLLAVFFCFWGMFDIVNWVVQNGNLPFPAPYFLFYLNPYAFADILITVGCASVFGVYVIGNYHELGNAVRKAKLKIMKVAHR